MPVSDAFRTLFQICKRVSERDARRVTETHLGIWEGGRASLGFYLAGKTLLGRIRGINAALGERVSVNHSHR